jgi:hypothetical protein
METHEIQNILPDLPAETDAPAKRCQYKGSTAQPALLKKANYRRNC